MSWYAKICPPGQCRRLALRPSLSLSEPIGAATTTESVILGRCSVCGWPEPKIWTLIRSEGA